MQTIRLRVNEKVYKNLIRLLSKWAELRQAQLKVLSVPNTGMAVTIDLGEPLRLFEISNDGKNFHIALATIEEGLPASPFEIRE